MRPRSIDRGNHGMDTGVQSAITRFNEAPINRPGKSARLAPAAPQRTGFNEAPINRPGK